MKTLTLIALIATLLLSGCGEDRVRAPECIDYGHFYQTQTSTGTAVHCADINETTRVVTTYDKDNNLIGSGLIEEYAHIVHITELISRDAEENGYDY